MSSELPTEQQRVNTEGDKGCPGRETTYVKAVSAAPVPHQALLIKLRLLEKVACELTLSAQQLTMPQGIQTL